MRGIPPGRLRILLLDTLLLIFCSLGIYNITQKANLDFQIISRNSQLIIDNVSIEESFLENGDIILSLQEFELSTKEEVEIFLDGRQPGEELSISILRSDQIINSKVKLVNFYSLAYTLIAVLVGMAFFVVAIIVLLKCKNLEIAKTLHWSFVFTAMIIMMTWGNYSILPIKLGFLTRTGFHAGYLFAPLFFLRFSFLFPSHLKFNTRGLFVVLNTLATILFLILCVIFYLLSQNIDIDMMRNYIMVFDLSSFFIALLILSAISIFIHTYSTTTVETDRRKLRWIILGFLMGPLSYLLFWVIPTRIWNFSIFPEEIVLLLVAFVPITFGIAIVRYQLMNIDLIFRRSIVYTTVISILLIIYTLIVSAATKYMNLPDSEIASIAAAVIIALLFQPAKVRVQKIVDRKFFRVQYDYRSAINKFNASIKDIHTEKDLVKKALDLIDSIIPVDKSGYFNFDDNQNILELVEHKNLDYFQSKKIKFHLNKESLYAIPISSKKKIEHGTEFADLTIEELEGIEADLIFNIISSKYKIHGLLILGQKKSETKYSAEDIDLLKTITSRLSLTLDRIKLHEEVIMEHLETERLEELNRLKSFFVSSVSHDLKTPLTSIKLFAERLKTMENIQSDKAKKYLNIIEGESDRLTRLINNVLDYSKIERGVQKYIFKEVDLVDITKSVLVSMEYQLNINKFIVTDKYLLKKMIVRGDEDAVSEALINLLSNAIKYSDEDKRIEITLDKRENYFSIGVKDYGRGIPKEDISDIFNPFFRTTDYDTDKAGGAGLGLAIVKYIIDSHKGKIELESQVGKGSNFSMLFPIGRDNDKNNDY